MLYHYRATIERVIDGDTVVANIDLGFRVYMSMTLRLYGIDAPEVRGKTKEAGIAAREYLADLIVKSDGILVETIQDKQGKYGRYLAVLYAGATNLNREMVRAGYAQKWLA